MNYYSPLSHIVTSDEDGRMLKSILQNQLGISRKLLSRLKQTDEGITVNGERQYISVRVKTGDCVEVRMQEEESEDILPQEMPLDILYEDEHLMVLNKPAGIVVHPTHGHYVNTLANGVVHYWQQRGVHCRFRPVHRLDQETSGVIAVAKNPYVQQHISEQMKAGKLLKEYTALVYGTVAASDGMVFAPIDRNPSEPHLRMVRYPGYEALTRYRVEQRLKGTTLLRLWLESGRTHQIRVHMQAIGHPLVGDKLYGLPPNHEQQEQADSGGSTGTAAAMTPTYKLPVMSGLERHALHAAKLGFFHPANGEWQEFTAPLPSDIENGLRVLWKEME